MITFAINGLGRIGRNFLRAVVLDSRAHKYIRIGAINTGPASPEIIAHMFKYDTLMGTFPGSVSMQHNELIINDMRIPLIQTLDPSTIDWKQYNVKWVVEASGKFTKREGASKHLHAGAEYVLITAPSKGDDICVVPGINEQQFDVQKHKIVSLGSCTTNAFFTMVHVLHDAFKIQNGFMTTVHAYTNSQVLLDVEDSDLRRCRAAALNIIPTSTGASKIISHLFPKLEGRIQAMAVRVPVAKVSFLDFTFTASQSLSVEAIHAAFTRATQGRMKGIIDLTHEPLVSSDFSGNNYSVVIDGLLTKVNGDTAKVCGWYDNEWGYSVRLKDFLIHVAQR